MLGAGTIGEALLAGLLRAGRAPDDLVFTERYAERAAELEARHGVRAVTPIEAAAHADVLFVAVKPQDVDALLGELAGIDPTTLVVSLCAGLPTTTFEGQLPAGTPVVRVMPNAPMVVGQAMSALSPGRAATEAHLDLAEELMSAVGRVVRVPESQQDAVTALSGSGPAYFYLVVEALVDAGVMLGLSRAVATELATQSALGASTVLRETGTHPVLLREGVSSPGGTTAAGVRALEDHGVRAAMYAAVEAARDRSVQLGAPSKS